MGADSPMISQYKKIKRDYPDSILMFRLGDFYEMFYDDAKTASKVLGIALTSRNKSSDNPVPLCGVPHHSVDGYITKLLEQGYKVAVCDQVEDPKTAKGIVERRVTRVLTPGAVLDTEKLDTKTNNYLAAIWKGKEKFGLAHADVSTGEFRATTFATMREVVEGLNHIEPREVLLPESLHEDDTLTLSLKHRWNPLLTVIDSWVWDYDTAQERLKEHMEARSLDAYGLGSHREAISACGAVIHYLEETQMEDLPRFRDLVYYDASDYMGLDEFTKTNLELTETIREGKRANTLLWVLDHTNTAMGGRLLKRWLNYPLLELEKIELRQDAVEALIQSPRLMQKVRKTLGEISDLERLIGRICTSYAKPSDLTALRDSASPIGELKGLIAQLSSKLHSRIHGELDELSDIAQLLEQAIAENPPNMVRDGGVIREGYDKGLDELMSIKRDGRKWISELEAEQKSRTGISSLKVRYNKVFGYYIEVTNPNLHLVPEDFIRKQTLVNAERFITEELKEFEDKILGAEEKIFELEKSLFEEVRIKIAAQDFRVKHTAALIGISDVLASFAHAADIYGYAKPEVNRGGSIELRDSRHPVVERMELGERFVPNDVKLDKVENQLLIITGPNMAGKSTIMRQVALITIMGQIGSFVPARSAQIGLVDKVFTRVGASDDLTRGRSTFMVEMVETAYILRHATKRSLVIFDEIGRGTSTFDGMSLAWAVAEHVYKIGARTMFATHYHRLAELALSKKRIKNYNVYVKEDSDRIVFLRKLLPGATSRSYGIQVARLAGMPEEALKSARSILSKLERVEEDLGSAFRAKQAGLFTDDALASRNEIKPEESEALDKLRGLDPMNTTPIDALNLLVELKKKLE